LGPPDAALEAAALGVGGDIDALADTKQVEANLVAGGVGGGAVRAELGEVAQGLAARPGQVAALGLVHAPGLAKAELDGRVAVALGRLHLGHSTGTDFDGRGATQAPTGVEDPRHA
jgi:hypothetical protein